MIGLVGTDRLDEAMLLQVFCSRFGVLVGKRQEIWSCVEVFSCDSLARVAGSLIIHPSQQPVAAEPSTQATVSPPIAHFLDFSSARGRDEVPGRHPLVSAEEAARSQGAGCGGGVVLPEALPKAPMDAGRSSVQFS